ncbi:MAG: aspartate kinase [Candidatus Eisenbacteria bacterium]|uniref:Aspartokinase n=1 Tax=Eiseniibacteriota bacterium TaxID=2212470 RepID=A0A956NGV4_UNCEI|nr:aspartate kinase [Candidatus Eisenbacteria bacterium]MCB9462384.1 aspartate kinase [Candidatus Eisenbacteria bacterium]
MALRVLKYGGTSVESPVRILEVARQILRYREEGDEVLVVVSAMGQTTDELIHLAHRVCRTPPRRELDMLLTAGERISMSLLAMALGSLGRPAISFTGSQSGIVTDSQHADARIFSIRPFRIEDEIAKGKVVIVAGFQGVSPEKEVTTLGRGGSDTTAVALAIRFGAEECQILTDVDGVWTGDPRVVPGAHRIDAIDYDAMIALSHFGGRVLYRRAVRLARRYGLPLRIRSTLTLGPGTRVPETPAERLPFSEETCPMESDRIVAVALESPVHWLRAAQPKDASPPRVRSQGTCLLSFSERTEDGTRRWHWVLPAGASPEEWNDQESWGSGATLHLERNLALVTLVGDGAHLGAMHLFEAEATLSAAGIPTVLSQTGAHALSFLVPEEKGEDASRLLHQRFLEDV